MLFGRNHLIAIAALLGILRAAHAESPMWPHEDGHAWARPCPAIVPASPLSSCYCNPRPCLIASGGVDIPILTRTSADSQDILYAGSYNNPVKNADDLGLDAGAGARVNLVFGGDCGCDVQFSYFGIHNMNQGESSDDPGVFYRFYGGVPVTPVSEYTAEYKSNYDSIEFNIRTRQWRRLAPLVGYRMIWLKEEFNIVQTASPSHGVFSEVQNGLYGLQFGGQGLIGEWGPTRLESVVKAGAYYTDYTLLANAADSGGSPLILKRSFSHTTFSGEVELTWIYQFCRNANLRCGYYAMWLQGVALAPNQSDNFRLATGEGSLDIGEVLYQGGYVGFELTL